MAKRGAARVQRKGNKFVLDLANGVSVTARRQSRMKLSNEASYQSARAALLSSQLRAMEKVLATKVLNSTNTTDTSVAQFALQQQLTDARITASNTALLQSQVKDIAASMTSIERSWAQLKADVANKLKMLAREYTLRYTKLKLALRNAKTPGQSDAINTSIAKLNDLYQLNKSNIINYAREDKARLSAQLADNTTALIAKKMELEKAIQASRQTRVLQEELERLKPTPIPTIPRVTKVARKRKTRRRRLA
jgi:hypothetical protein